MNSKNSIISCVPERSAPICGEPVVSGRSYRDPGYIRPKATVTPKAIWQNQGQEENHGER